jgi:hypothetical protein
MLAKRDDSGQVKESQQGSEEFGLVEAGSTNNGERSLS